MIGVFLLILAVGAHGHKWDAVEIFETSILGFSQTAEQVIRSVDDVLHNVTFEATAFLSSLDDLSIVKEVSSMPDGYKCKDKFLDMKDLRNSFKMSFSQLEGPLLKRKAEIKSRFRDVLASLAVYQGLADGKEWGCKLAGKDCQEETKSWLEENLQELTCKVITECSKNKIVKRSIRHQMCRRNQYYTKNQNCLDMDDSYICNRDCNRNFCEDEPSSECVRYCVGGFHCLNLKCIDRDQVCDGKDDCGDNSDEEDCKPREIPVSNCSIEAGKYLCSNKLKCITVSSVCDGNTDCDDGSDEGGECGSGFDCADECRLAGGVCVTTPKGKVCLSGCPPGTEETPLGCSAAPYLSPTTISHLLEEIPRMVARYRGAFKLLQSRTIDHLSSSLSQVSSCRGDPFLPVLKLREFTTSPHPPHTTTKRRTTTHRTTTQSTVELLGGEEEEDY